MKITGTQSGQWRHYYLLRQVMTGWAGNNISNGQTGEGWWYQGNPPWNDPANGDNVTVVAGASDSFNVQVPLELETVTRHRVTGRVGGGEVPVLLRSSSGDIGVMSGGN